MSLEAENVLRLAEEGGSSQATVTDFERIRDHLQTLVRECEEMIFRGGSRDIVARGHGGRAVLISFADCLVRRMQAQQFIEAISLVEPTTDVIGDHRGESNSVPLRNNDSLLCGLDEVTEHYAMYTKFDFFYMNTIRKLHSHTSLVNDVVKEVQSELATNHEQDLKYHAMWLKMVNGCEYEPLKASEDVVRVINEKYEHAELQVTRTLQGFGEDEVNKIFSFVADMGQFLHYNRDRSVLVLVTENYDKDELDPLFLMFLALRKQFYCLMSRSEIPVVWKAASNTGEDQDAFVFKIRLMAKKNL